MSFNISTNPKISASWDTINSPQAYSQKPLSASYVRDAYYIEEPPKDSFAKKAFKVGATLAVIAGGLALARSKVDGIKDIDITDATKFKGKDKVKFYIAKAGQMVIDGFNKIKFWDKKAENAGDAGKSS